MKKLMYLCSIVILTQSVFAQTFSLGSVVGSDNAQKLLTDGYLYNEDGRAVVKFVQNGLLKQTMQQYLKELDANFSLEFVYFVPNESRFVKRSTVEILEKLLHIQSLNNAYMIRNNKEEALFSHVEVFQDFNNRKVQPSLPTISLPFKYTQYINLKDARFGKIDYRVDYLADDETIVLSMLNYSTLSYMLRKIADPQKMRLSFMQQQLKEGTLYIGHIAANIHSVEKAKDAIHLPSFFSRRVEGLKGWYFKQIYGIKVKQDIYPVAIK